MRLTLPVNDQLPGRCGLKDAPLSWANAADRLPRRQLKFRICQVQMLAAARQAEANREKPGDIPLGVVKVKGKRTDDALVVMRLAVFSEYFVGGLDLSEG